MSAASQAANSRPDLKAFASHIVATAAVALSRPTPGIAARCETDTFHLRHFDAVGAEGPLPSQAHLLLHIRSGRRPYHFSHEIPLDEAPSAYKHFDQRDKGWTKVIMHPRAAA
jgi:hypothetical protein